MSDEKKIAYKMIYAILKTFFSKSTINTQIRPKVIETTPVLFICTVIVLVQFLQDADVE